MPREKNNPQLEDGYIRIANELLEAILAFGFSQREILVLLSIIRKTYGFNKKTDDMSASQIAALCKVPRQHVTTTLLSLATRNVITKSPGQFGSIIGIQKNHRKWIGQNIAKGSLASPNLGQGCPDSGQGSNEGEKMGNSAVKEYENSPQASCSMDSTSPNLGHPCPDSGHVPIWVSTCPDLGQVDSPNLGHTKDNLPKDTKQKTPAGKIRFATWLQNCKQQGIDPIPANHSVFDYAESVGISVDFVRLCWLEFKRKYADSTKTYTLWPKHFGNAVRENWYGIWFEKDGEWHLTTRGKQIEKEHAEKSRKGNDASE